MMASPKRPPQLDVLDRMISEALVQSAKSLKRRRDSSNGGGFLDGRDRVNDAHIKFNGALDDLESELNRAKAVLMRDVEQLRAKRRPIVIPDAVMLPHGAAPMSAPMSASMSAPMSASMSAPMSAPISATLSAGSGNAPPTPTMSQTSTATVTASSNPLVPGAPAGHGLVRSTSSSTLPSPRPGAKPKQAAPFPNMAPDPSPSPTLANAKAKGATRSPQLGTALTAKNAAKGGSPALKTATAPGAKTNTSPAFKSATGSPGLKSATTGSPGLKSATASPVPKPAAASPALKTGSPALKAGSPALKSASPSGKAAGKAGSKGTPSPALKTASPTPTPTNASTAKVTPPTGNKSAPASTTAAKATKATASAPPTAKATAAPAPIAHVPVPASTAASPQATATPSQPNPLTGLFDTSSGGSAPSVATKNPELNFTDMQFSLAPISSTEPLSPAAQTQGQRPAATQAAPPPSHAPAPAAAAADAEFDITAFVTDVANNILSDDFGEPRMLGPPSGPAPAAGGGSAADAVPPRPGEDTTMADLFGTGGPDTDMGGDPASAGGGLGGEDSFNDFFFGDNAGPNDFDGGDAGAAEFADAYFGL